MTTCGWVLQLISHILLRLCSTIRIDSIHWFVNVTTCGWVLQLTSHILLRLCSIIRREFSPNKTNIINRSGFQKTVESNQAISLVLVLVGFLVGPEKLWVITLPIGNKQVIGVGLTSKWSWLMKPTEMLLLVYVTPSRFQSNWLVWFYFCSSLVRENVHITPWIPSVCGWLKMVVSLRLWLAQ